MTTMDDIYHPYSTDDRWPFDNRGEEARALRAEIAALRAAERFQGRRTPNSRA